LLAKCRARLRHRHLLTVAQFKMHKRERAQSLSTALAAPRLFIIGDERSLSEL
jgi:hypothetical protein